MKSRHSGFSVDNGKRIQKEDSNGTEAIAQYMMRNVFSTENINYIEKTGKVIYRTGKMQGKHKHNQNRKNFSVYDAEEFIAAITQHIPKKSFQTTRYYGAYSNKVRGMQAKAENSSKDKTTETVSDEVEVIDVSKYQPKNVPSLTWRECIKKIWKADPLICPECQSEMSIISFITETQIVRKILKYLDLWDDVRDSQCRTEQARDPPHSPGIPDEVVYVPFEDAAWDRQESPDFVG